MIVINFLASYIWAQVHVLFFLIFPNDSYPMQFSQSQALHIFPQKFLCVMLKMKQLFFFYSLAKWYFSFCHIYFFLLRKSGSSGFIYCLQTCISLDSYPQHHVRRLLWNINWWLSSPGFLSSMAFPPIQWTKCLLCQLREGWVQLKEESFLGFGKQRTHMQRQHSRLARVYSV